MYTLESEEEEERERGGGKGAMGDITDRERKG